MVSGNPAFGNPRSSDDEIYAKILRNEHNMPSPRVIPSATRNLISRLLEPDVTKRISTAEEIKSHEFFKEIDWELVKTKRYISPWIPPPMRFGGDTANFDIYMRLEGNTIVGKGAAMRVLVERPPVSEQTIAALGSPSHKDAGQHVVGCSCGAASHEVCRCHTGGLPAHARVPFPMKPLEPIHETHSVTEVGTPASDAGSPGYAPASPNGSSPADSVAATISGTPQSTVDATPSSVESHAFVIGTPAISEVPSRTSGASSVHGTTPTIMHTSGGPVSVKSNPEGASITVVEPTVV
jgi:hypothetical protein